MDMSFASEVRCHFDPVAERFGLSCVASSEQRVRYENEAVFLTVHFDNGRSYELGVEVGRKTSTQSERPFSLVEVLRLREAAADAASIDGIIVSDAARLPDAIKRLAALTSEYTSDFLRCNDFSFAQVGRLREKEGDAYALERDLRVAKAKSEIAWSSRNFKALIAALEPLEPHLSSAEKMRLEYSRKQLANWG